jgi:membrane associated rhomboid family serine protease
MLPLSDGLSPRSFPFVNVAIIVANFAVWLFYELPHLDASIAHASFYPCTVDGSCHGPEPWGISSRVFGLIGIFPVTISAWFFLGFWFLYQLYEANFGMFGADANGGGVAFFAHVGGFVFGLVVARALVSAGRVEGTAPALGARA